MINRKIFFLGVLLAGFVSSSVSHGRDLEKLQQDFLGLKFGMFIHFNMSTFVPGGWSSGKEDPILFNPTEMDFGQWADVANSAKMKYAILTVKHTGGWCLWDTATSDRDITWFKNYKDGQGDMVKEFTEAFRSRGLKVGVYYCFPLWGGDQWKKYQTLPAEDYAEGTVDALAMIKTHFTELLTNYGDIDIIWIDQSGSPNGGLKEGDWRKIKAHMHALQPDCLVIANNASDLADSDVFGYEYPYSLELPSPGNTVPTEVCDKLNQGWFANPDAPAVPIRTADYVVNKMLRPLNDNSANLLLNCAPDTRGLLHEETVALLQKVGEMWDPDESSHAADELYGISRAPVKVVPTSDKKIAIIFAPTWTAEKRMTASALLKESKAAGTFFVNEATAKADKAALRKLVEAGHEIGNGAKSDSPLTLIEKARLLNGEVDAVQKQLRAVQTPKMFRAPGNQYNEKVWSVLNYQGLTAMHAAVFSGQSSVVVPGGIIEVSTIDDLVALLGVIEANNFTAVSASDLFAASTSKRLQSAVAHCGADVMTGRE